MVVGPPSLGFAALGGQYFCGIDSQLDLCCGPHIFWVIFRYGSLFGLHVFVPCRLPEIFDFVCADHLWLFKVPVMYHFVFSGLTFRVALIFREESSPCHKIC
jgi:hypothetical protein